MSRSRTLLIIAAALVVAGVVAVVLQPGPPDPVCVEDGGPSSGFVDEDGCPISIESYEEIAEYESSPKPFRIVGAVLIVLGLITAVVALVRGRRRDAAGGSPGT